MPLALSGADLASCSDMPGVNKPVSATRSSQWPMQGGLQSITNTTTVRTNIPVTAASNGYIEVPLKTATILPIVPDTGESTRKTPSPKKVTIKIEPASGKENLTNTPQSNK